MGSFLQPRSFDTRGPVADTASAGATGAIAVLNDLISTCVDGLESFRAAADAAKHSEAKAFFLSRVRTTDSSRHDLEGLVRQLRGEPTGGSQVPVSVHWGSIDLKPAVSGTGEAATFNEAVRAAQDAVAHYRLALKKTLPRNVRTVIERQWKQAEENLDRVRSLATGLHAG